VIVVCITFEKDVASVNSSSLVKQNSAQRKVLLSVKQYPILAGLEIVQKDQLSSTWTRWPLLLLAMCTQALKIYRSDMWHYWK
jgi:hypothetical protein